MSVHLSRLALVLVSLGVSTPAFAGWVGINGSSCDFTSMQDAIDAASPRGQIWIAEGAHNDDGFVMDKDLVVVRGDSNCATGGAVNALLHFNGVGQGEVDVDVVATFENVSFRAGVGSNGGNLLIDSGADVRIDNALFWEGDATFGGGVAVLADAHLEIYGGWFLENTAGQGGAIYADVDSLVELKGGLGNDLTFELNTADNLGGAIDCWGCTLSIYEPYGALGEVEFTENSSTVAGINSRGGAIYVQDGTATLYDATLSDNSASYGGAIAGQDSTITLEGVTISSNSADERGGGVYVYDTDLDAERCTWSSNSAPRGGGLYTVTTTVPSITFVGQSVFDNNTATAATTGSAIDARDAQNSVTLTDSVVSDGVSPTAPGAAIAAQDGVVMDVIDSTIADNQRWGLASLSGSSITMSGSIVWGNSAGGVTGTGSATCSDVQGGVLPGVPANLSSNPLFIDAAGDNYDLGAASPARNQCAAHVGTPLSGFSRALGLSDMGAFNN